MVLWSYIMVSKEASDAELEELPEEVWSEEFVAYEMRL